MRILVTGASGFVGKHLTKQLKQTLPHAEIHGTTLIPEPDVEEVRYHPLDLCQSLQVDTLLRELQPEQIYHLAGQASIDLSFKDPWGTFEANVQGTLHLLNACRHLAYAPRILVITSAEIYGKIRPQDLPLTEETPLRPANPYSVSKVSQDLLAQQFFFTYDLPIVRARPFNHLGAGQSEHFVATAFAMQIARIEAGLQSPIIRVGNLNSSRDFTNVRDIVRAYTLLMQQGEVGQAYNIASGKTHTIQALLDTLLSFCAKKIDVQVDPSRLRPSDVPIISVNCERLHATTGWQPQISFEDTLREVLEDCRQRVRLSSQEKPTQ